MTFERILGPTFSEIELIENTNHFVFTNNNHQLNGQYFDITKDEKSFTFTATSKNINDSNSNKDFHFSQNFEYKFTNDNVTLYIEGKDIIIKSISYSNNKEKNASGSIYSITNTKTSEKTNSLFKRFVLPINTYSTIFNDFQRQNVEIKYLDKKVYQNYLPIIINNYSYYIYEIEHNEKKFIIIDSNHTLSENLFRTICYNILLSLAFITGNLYHKECYVLGYESKEMGKPLELTYYSMNGSLLSDQPTFTSSFYSIYSSEIDKCKTKEERKEIWEKLGEDIYDFSIDDFSSLVESIANSEKIQRALLLFIHGHLATLEVKLPIYFVALEAITSFISKNNKQTVTKLNPIKDKAVANEIIKLTKENLKKIIDDKNLTIDDINIEVLYRKLDSLNSPTNADKLSEPFKSVGYVLNDEYLKILKDRNLYLHGSFKNLQSDDETFKNVFYISLRIRFLITALILKNINFSGKIINYCATWSHITEIPVDEDKLLKI